MAETSIETKVADTLASLDELTDALERFDRVLSMLGSGLNKLKQEKK